MISITKPFEERIINLAKQQHITPQALLERALQSFMYDLEDIKAANQHLELEDEELLTVADASKLLYEIAHSN